MKHAIIKGNYPKGNVIEKIRTGVKNYYGEIIFINIDNTHYLMLSDHSSECFCEISENFFIASKKEFEI